MSDTQTTTASPVSAGAALLATSTPPPDPAAAAAAAAAGTATPGGNGQQPPAPPAWAAELPEPERAVVLAKGWKDPADVVTSYRGLETLLGADKAGRAIVKPKDGDAAAREAFFNELGRPEKPEGYELEKAVPAGQSPEFASKAAAAMHKLGLTKDQAAGIAAWYGEEAKHQGSQISDEFVAQSRTEVETLQRSWGDQRVAKAESIARAGRLLGLSSEDIVRWEMAVGTTKMLTALLNVGESIREDRMPGGAGTAASPTASAPLAIAEIERLKTDLDFQKKLAAGDKSAKSVWDNLYKVAYPT